MFNMVTHTDEHRRSSNIDPEDASRVPSPRTQTRFGDRGTFTCTQRGDKPRAGQRGATVTCTCCKDGLPGKVNSYLMLQSGQK